MITVDISNVWGQVSLPDLLAVEKEVFDADNIIKAYKLIICKQLSSDFSAAEREHIKQICMMAYWRVVDSNKQE